MRVGVIGTGFGARVVAPAFAATPGCEVVDVVTARDAAAVAALCRRADVDLVSVHSPPYLHEPHVRLALDAGHSVLCDKPFTVDPARSDALAGLAAGSSGVHLVNFELRFHPVRAKMKALLDEGAIGVPERVVWIHVSSGARDRPAGWLFERDAGGGFVGAWCSHAVDTLRWWFGEIVDVEADTWITVPERPGPGGAPVTVDAEDGCRARLRLDRGVTVTIDATYAAPATLAPRILVIGSDGLLECVGDARLTLRGGSERATVLDTARDEPDRAAVHEVAMRRFAGVVHRAADGGDRDPDLPGFADGAACDEVLARVRLSAARRASRRGSQPGSQL